MTLTAAQRAKKNQENARKSTGPTSEAGKAKSRLNAVKHGLRAEVVALPNEDPDEVEARSQSWNDFYQPQSPAAHHLVNQCVRATLLSDRVDRFHSAALSKQIRDAENAWQDTHGDHFSPTLALLKTEPDVAVIGLKESARGCRYLIEQWQTLAGEFESQGCWSDYFCEQAVNRLGSLFEYSALATNPSAWMVALCNQVCLPVPDVNYIARFFQPGHVPALFVGRFHLGNLPTVEECRTLIRGTIAEEIERLEALLPALDAAAVDPLFVEASDRASILHDERSARLFLRYHSEARSSFHRAYGELMKTLARDAEEAAAAVAEASSPNEATSDESPSSTETSDAPTGEPSAETDPAPPPPVAQNGPPAPATAVRPPVRLVSDARVTS